MTVTLEEFQVATPGASASGALTLATTLVSSDLVVMVATRSVSTFGTLTIDGSSPPTYADYQNTTSTRLRIATKTGITGSHAVSYTTPATSSTNRIAAYVVRGLTNSAITSSSASTWTTTNTAPNTDESPASVSVGDGQVVIALGTASAGTLTFPSSTLPASGWVSDYADTAGSGRMSMIHMLFTSADTAQVSVRSSTTTTIAALMLVLGDAASVPPLASTFTGWGNPIF